MPDTQGLGAQVGELGLDRLGVVEPHAGPFLRASLGEDESAAVRQEQLEGGLLRLLAVCLEECEPPGGHEVDVQHELAVLGREEEVLATAACSCELSAVESGERGLEGLQGGNVRRSGLLHRRRAHARVEHPPVRLHLGQLRHAGLQAEARRRRGNASLWKPWARSG